jgi:hypothetical protein
LKARYAPDDDDEAGEPDRVWASARSASARAKW